ncbi:MAG: extracellular solute-binding protein [Pseudomonadota bacterium]
MAKRPKNRKLFQAAAGILILSFAAIQPVHSEPMHGIAMHGKPAMPADFAHLPYANPNAPKGGKITYGVRGTFDSLNPFVIKSMRTTARGIWDPAFGNLVYETLLFRSRDEPFTMYGLLAETLETDDNRTWVEFHLRKEARWSDGKPVTVDDVLFTFDLLKEKGRPPYSSRMRKVERIEPKGERGFRIVFNDQADRELALLFGLMPILPKHAIDPETFQNSTLKPPIGSGPYLVTEVKPGESISYKKNPDWWAKDLPVMRGFFNFAEIEVEYYRAANAQFEAFKKGLFDIYPEGNPAKWRQAYDFPAVSDGRVIKDTFIAGTPTGMLGFVFNTRRPPFDNIAVRKALALAFDFEWTNQNLFFGAYQRTGSYFHGSELSALGRPASEAEKALLAPFPDAVSSDVMDGTYQPPKTDGSGRDRKALRAALRELKSAGFSLKDGKMVDPSGQPLAFEVMIASQEQERLSTAWQRTLAPLGIEVTIRTTDDAQFQQRSNSFDFDVIMKKFSASLSPGAEQIFRWGSQSQNLEGSFNFAGVANPAIDAMIDAMLNARDRDAFVAAVRAYDRVLISGHYLVPLYHLKEQRLARWSRVEHPEKSSLYGYQLPVWWAKK